MQNITITVTTEQEERVLLAFLNALDYDFKLSNTQHPSNHLPDEDLPDDDKNILSHYATE